MALEGKTTNELISIASNGGGFRIRATGRTTNELISIAKAANAGGTQIVFLDLEGRTTNELISISKNGGGSVSFDSSGN
jgi:hypothetical protein